MTKNDFGTTKHNGHNITNSRCTGYWCCNNLRLCIPDGSTRRRLQRECQGGNPNVKATRFSGAEQSRPPGGEATRLPNDDQWHACFGRAARHDGTKTVTGVSLKVTRLYPSTYLTKFIPAQHPPRNIRHPFDSSTLQNVDCHCRSAP